MALKYFLIVLSVVYFVNCENANKNNTEQHAPVKKSPPVENSPATKGREIRSYIGMMSCALKYDMSCFTDAAQDYLEVRRTELLAQADDEFSKAMGRSDTTSKPSHLAKMISKLVSDLADMFKNGFSGFFETAREADDEDVNDVDENDVTESSGNSNGETRALFSNEKKKKKKKPLKGLIRLIKVAVIAIVVILKLSILLKILQTAMQFKFLLISVGSFALQAAKLWMSFREKKGQHGHEEIVYKNPYTSGDEYAGPGGSPYGGEYNAARSGGAQELAYFGQRV